MRLVILGDGPMLESCVGYFFSNRSRFDHIHLVAVSAGPIAISSLGKIANRYPRETVHFIDSSRLTIEEVQLALEHLDFDVLLSVQFHQVLPRSILALAVEGSFNIHNALIPDYRGHNTITHEILDGSKEHVVTLHEMVDQVDRGRVVVQSKFAVTPGDTAFSVHKRSLTHAVQVFRDFLLVPEFWKELGLANTYEKGKFFRRDSLNSVKQVGEEVDWEDLSISARSVTFPSRTPLIKRTAANTTLYIADGSVRRILLIVGLSMLDTPTVSSHILGLANFSRNQVIIWCPAAVGECTPDFDTFDTIVLHYTLVLAQWQDNYRQLPAAVRAQISAFMGQKIAFIQDEYRWIVATVNALRELGVSRVYTLAEATTIPVIYGHFSDLDAVFETTLAGYLTDEWLDEPPLDWSERSIDVGYRARGTRVNAEWLGTAGVEKLRIGNDFIRDARKWGLATDISTREKDRLSGSQWRAFLLRCRAVLGTESGSSYLDFFDTRRPGRVSGSRQPGSDFGDHSRLLASEATEYRMISPRMLEAAATRTLMILYPGHYSGLLLEWEHFVPLQRDHSNIREVVSVIRDEKLSSRITTKAFEEVAKSPEVHVSFLAEQLDRGIAKDRFEGSSAEKIFVYCGAPRRLYMESDLVSLSDERRLRRRLRALPLASVVWAKLPRRVRELLS